MGAKKMIEILIGAILFGLGMTYLFTQYRSLEKLNEVVSCDLVKQESLYQQYSDGNINTISDEELCAVIMGYREYPIIIDGVKIKPDQIDYEIYLPLKEGYYNKSYQYDFDHRIEQIIYTYIGSL